MITKICFVRHGETEANVKKIVQGWEKYSLNDSGIEQMKKTARKLMSQNWNLIISSDLVRAKMSAEIIGKTLNVPIFYSELFREKKPDSSLEGKGFEELENILEVNKDGESAVMFFRRVRQSMKLMANVLVAENIIVVSHEEFIRYAIRSLTKKEYGTIPNGSEVLLMRSEENDLFYI